MHYFSQHIHDTSVSKHVITADGVYAVWSYCVAIDLFIVLVLRLLILSHFEIKLWQSER